MFLSQDEDQVRKGPNEASVHAGCTCLALVHFDGRNDAYRRGLRVKVTCFSTWGGGFKQAINDSDAPL